MRTALGFLVIAAASATAAGQTTRPAGSRPAFPSSVLRIARSKDGLAFDDAGEVFLADASGPAVVCLPNGHLLTMFDRAAGSSGGATVMAVSRSSDEGRTWSRPQSIRFAGSGAPAVRCGHPSLVLTPNGLLRLYFVSIGSGKDVKREPAGGPREASMILSAVSRNGLEYTLDREVQIPLEAGWSVHPTAMRIEQRVDLYVDAIDDTDAAPKARAGAALRLTSPDGRRFRRAAPPRTQGVSFVGSVVAIDKRFRAYVTGDGGVCSMVSNDGLVWTAEAGVRVAGGADAAVAALKDDTFLMLYCAPADDRSRGRTQLALVGGAAKGDFSQSSTPPSPPYEGGEVRGGSGEGGGSGEWESFAPESAMALPGGGAGALPGDAPVFGDASSRQGDQALGNSEQAGAAPDEADVFPPKPDLATPVDYLSWLQQQFPVSGEGNAYDAYKAFMPDPDDPPGSKPWWPEDGIDDMFNGEYTGPIIPWDPTQYPKWEQTHQSMQPLLDRFREISRLDVYAMPIGFTEKQWAETPDGQPLLFELQLPGLNHHRAMIKGTMADTWRAENGQVSPERMLDGWETALRGAGHIEQGPTLIHQLVGMAEQGLVERNALAALQHNVFSADQMEQALDVLSQRDRFAPTAHKWMAGEYAGMMETLQYVLTPGPDGQPQVNPERAGRVVAMLQPWSTSPLVPPDAEDQTARFSPEDARKTVEVFDGYYRELAEQWRVGYPQVRRADVDAIAEKYREQSHPLVKPFIMSTIGQGLGGAYGMTARKEASRRATQLSYAVHLFKARNGRWPASLDELPAEFGAQMRTDPFTGGNFGYRVTESGATIYTLGENARDDGGVHSRSWGRDNKTDAESDDYVFWPPQATK